jgi:nucleoside-diphosphate-sugar epimerase
MSLRVLFIGGTGQISLECVKQAVKAGHEVTLFNRGQRQAELPAEVKIINGDLKDREAYGALARHDFDVVCQFIAFLPEQVAEDIRVFTGHTGQYIFISSASVYEKPPRHYVITEKTPTVNPYWLYSQNKIACEALLKADRRLGWTIMRPSHTVRTGLPTMMGEGDLVPERMLAGQPVIVAGDGATPWTLTRSADFAVPFVGLFGKKEAIGEDFHITSDRAHTWDEIYHALAAGIGATARIVHVPTDTLVRYRPEWEGPLTGDKSWTALFDNSKVKRVAGDFTCAEDLETILSESIRFYKARRAAGGVQPSEFGPLFDRICSEQLALGR